MLKYKCKKCKTPLGFEGLCWKCRAEQTRNEVLSWSEEEINYKIKNLIDNADKIEDYRSEEYKDFWKLLSYRGIISPEVVREAIKVKNYYPYEMYYHAPSDVRDKLIDDLLKTDIPIEASRILMCLGMQGDDISLKTLLELEKNPRCWREKLYVDPSEYAKCGNWSFDKKGNRIELGYDVCYPLVKGDRNLDSTATVGRIREEVCPNCGCHMVDMLVLDCNDSRLRFLGINGTVTATCCPNCVCFTEASFCRFTLDGACTPIYSDELMIDNIENYVEEDLNELETNNFVLGEEPVPLFYGAFSDDVNTIGGFANWVQDWNCTTCPDCGKPMKYLAQLQWDTIIDGYEGTLYIEICPECKVVSMHHQQT